MHIKEFLLSLILLTCTTVALTPPLDTVPIDPPVLKCDSGTIKLSTLHISVEVVGKVTQTTYAMSFYNERDRILEAELEFPLPQGATVSRFAMDVNGKLREAVSIPKEKGRKVFEEIVRKNIDPGLLEKTKGNNYKARVYPVPAKGYKQVVVRYESELKDIGSSYVHTLPLHFSDTLDSFSVNIDVFENEISPQIKESPDDAITFTKWEKSWNASFKKAEYQVNKAIRFVVPKLEKKSTVKVANDSTFYISLSPKLDKRAKDAPSSVTIIWDVSNSAGKSSKDSIFALLSEYLQWCNRCDVTLVPFRNRILPEKAFPIKNGNSNEVISFLKRVDYDGGTQLGKLDFTEYNSDEILLITDGLSNFGKSSIILGKTPVYTLNSATIADHSYLSYIANATGGLYLNLLEKSTSECIPLLKQQPLLFLGVTSESGITELYPSTKQQITGDFTLSGKLTKALGKATLLFGYGKKVTEEIEITLNRDDVISTELLKLLWAQKKLSDLSMQYDKNRADIDAHAEKYTLITKDRSLLILDRVEDYVEYDITPPEELLKAYNKIKAENKKVRQQAEQASIEKILRKLQERLSWWEKDFDYKGCRKPRKEKKKMAERPRELISMEANMAREERTHFSAGFESPDDLSGFKDSLSTNTRPGQGSITLKKWSPDTPYLKKLKEAKKGEHYRIYLKEKSEYANSSAFFLDVADFFIELGEKELALQVLSNIAEMKLENPQLLRILAHRLRQLGEFPLAILLFEEVLAMRNEEPQSYRDLGLSYADNKQYIKAVEMLYKVAVGIWDERFSDIDIIALNEMNGVIEQAANNSNSKEIQNRNISQWLKKGGSEITLDSRLIKNMPCDVRVVLNWDADNCDMDLWVTDPIGEKCYYQHKRTCIGGHMSADFTQGYGPEEFLLKDAMPGTYKIEVNYYGNRQQTLAGATTIQVELITDHGKKTEKRKAITLRLKDEKEVVYVGEFTF